MAEAVEDAFRYDRLVLASITYQGDIFPFMSTFIHTLAEHAYQNRTVALSSRPVPGRPQLPRL